MAENVSRMDASQGDPTWAVGGPTLRCRSCGGRNLAPVIDLGETPVANALLSSADQAHGSYPLRVVFCEGCALVQLGFHLPATALFDDEYPYYSSFSDALCAHARTHAEELIEARGLSSRSLAVEVASNDGYLLRNFVARGVRALGVDPARGPAAAAEAVGVPTVVGFFGLEVAKGIVAEHGHADVVIANNVMAHVPDLDDFVAGLSELLAPGGVLTIENPYVRSMIEQVEFDTIYHEHYCYFSTSAVDALMRRHGLYVNHVEHFAELHGGTNRWHIGRTLDRSDSCRRHLEREQSDGLTTVGYYQDFAGAAHACQKALRVLVEGLVADGATVAAYGAAAKGATLLNSAGIGADLVSYVVDRNVHKQGRFMPGCLLEILPPEALIERKPDFVVLLAWNFAAEIMAQQREYTRGRGRFIVPVPMPRIAGEGASPEPGGPAGDPGTDPA